MVEKKADDLTLMRRIDEQYLRTPFYGSRKLAAVLGVNRKRIQRLMRVMGIEAVMDWYSRYVLSWRLSNTLTGSLCLEALDEALSRSQPEIFNSDQGSQFTAAAFTSRLESCGVAISMDGRGRAIDNVFIERLWRSVKYEKAYLRDDQDGWDAETSLASYFRLYDEERIHQSLGYRTPGDVYRDRGSSGTPPRDEKQTEIARNTLIAG